MNKLKLTLAERRLLRELAEQPEQTCWDEYKPLLRLVALGLVTTDTPCAFATTARLTEAGREWLAMKGTK